VDKFKVAMRELLVGLADDENIRDLDIVQRFLERFNRKV
jgi:hypothetical protein